MIQAGGLQLSTLAFKLCALIRVHITVAFTALGERVPLDLIPVSSILQTAVKFNVALMACLWGAALTSIPQCTMLLFQMSIFL